MNHFIVLRKTWIPHLAKFSPMVLIGGLLLSSGLAWLAWTMGTPVVMISGFTHPQNEFRTPFRIFNHHTCNSCWNDARLTFDHSDFFWCPRHRDTPRQFECSRLIQPEQVIDALNRIPVEATTRPQLRRLA